VRARLAAAAACAGLLTISCGGGDATPALVPQAAAAPAGATATVPHGDHNPPYGGLVLMNGDLHFEVVLGRDGAARVYFSDATRAELPAATASDVTVTVTGKSQPPQIIPLHIDETGESWIGRGRPVEGDATVRVAYTSHGKPYFIDVPVPR
jgi:hypothetical protein